MCRASLSKGRDQLGACAFFRNDTSKNNVSFDLTQYNYPYGGSQISSNISSYNVQTVNSRPATSVFSNSYYVLYASGNDNLPQELVNRTTKFQMVNG